MLDEFQRFHTCLTFPCLLRSVNSIQHLIPLLPLFGLGSHRSAKGESHEYPRQHPSKVNCREWSIFRGSVHTDARRFAFGPMQKSPRKYKMSFAFTKMFNRSRTVRLHLFDCVERTITIPDDVLKSHGTRFSRRCEVPKRPAANATPWWNGSTMLNADSAETPFEQRIQAACQPSETRAVLSNRILQGAPP